LAGGTAGGHFENAKAGLDGMIALTLTGWSIFVHELAKGVERKVMDVGQNGGR
jgi:hypothetical protein